MPLSARMAVGVLAGLAVLLLLNALFTFLARDAVVDTFAHAQPDQPRSTAEQIVLIYLVQATDFGVPAAVSAWAVSQRRVWGRWTGLATGVLLLLITLGATLLAGGVAVSTLLVLVLCIAAVVSLLARTTAAWTTGPRSRSTS